MNALRNSCWLVIGLAALFSAGDRADAQMGRYKVDRGNVPQDLVPRSKGFERTDLFDDASYFATVRLAPERQQQSINEFKRQLQGSNSRDDYIRAAKEFLEREGFRVAPADDGGN